jgi:hypothetical protein
VRADEMNERVMTTTSCRTLSASIGPTEDPCQHQPHP